MITSLLHGSRSCGCAGGNHEPRLVAVTGGPGAGKSAVLEMAARSFCPHVVILPEAATILFGGGFPRLPGPSARRAAQRTIFHAQRELERLALEDGNYSMILCDRGTLDGAAYWPGEPQGLWNDLGIQKESELERYYAVLHLGTPTRREAYNHSNVVRVETPVEAHLLDERILAIWAEHARRSVIPPMDDFPQKALRALEVLRAQVPDCCRV